MDLMMTDNKVEMINDYMQAFFLEFHQPKYNPHQEGVWKIRVELPDAYPYKSLSIDFVNKIYSVWFSSMLSNSAVSAVVSAQNNTTKKTTPGHAVLAHMGDSVGTTAMMRLDSE